MLRGRVYYVLIYSNCSCCEGSVLIYSNCSCCEGECTTYLYTSIALAGTGVYYILYTNHLVIERVILYVSESNTYNRVTRCARYSVCAAISPSAAIFLSAFSAPGLPHYGKAQSALIVGDNGRINGLPCTAHSSQMRRIKGRRNAKDQGTPQCEGLRDAATRCIHGSDRQ